MRILSPRRLVILGITSFAVLFIIFGPAKLAFAADTNGGGLEISPALVELNGQAGKTYTIGITVTNVTTSNLVFDSHVNDFAAKDESGVPSIILNDTQIATSIKDWVKPIASFTLKPHEQKKITASIVIPTGAEPGGHYGVIRFTSQTGNAAQQGVGQTASAGTLILVRVDGNITEKLDLASFEVTKDKAANSFFESGPLTFVARFQNKGSIHLKPIGQIEVKDAFGHSVDVLPINTESGNVLPGSIRRFETNLDKSWLFGRYTADLSVAYGTTGQAIVQTISFWVIPYKLLLIALIVLVTIIYILRNLIKRYNKYIIKHAYKR